MAKDVLLIRSNQYHLAVPTDRLLEIVNLEDYHTEQQANLEAASPSCLVPISYGSDLV